MKIGDFKVTKMDAHTFVKQILVGYDKSVRPYEPIYKYIVIKEK